MSCPAAAVHRHCARRPSRWIPVEVNIIADFVNVRAALEQNFDELRALLDMCGDEQLCERLGEGEWSVREILLHLVHSERWLHPQLMLLRREVAPHLPIPRVGGVTLPDTESEASLPELRWALTSVREDTERLLADLSPDHLREPANFELDGDVLDMSLRTIALTAADHQLFHVRQIQRTLGIVP
ncbi:MAG: DinB family protein [Chloroflexota bacterium]|nr:DinB family protein [Chloroflexota bacterium]MDE2894762.1 DinB family protein [Chloroflexota bacterium]